MALQRGRRYLVLTHAVTRVKDDPFAHHRVLISRVVIEAVVGLPSILQLKDKVWLTHFPCRCTLHFQSTVEALIGPVKRFFFRTWKLLPGSEPIGAVSPFQTCPVCLLGRGVLGRRYPGTT